MMATTTTRMIVTGEAMMSYRDEGARKLMLIPLEVPLRAAAFPIVVERVWTANRGRGRE